MTTIVTDVPGLVSDHTLTQVQPGPRYVWNEPGNGYITHALMRLSGHERVQYDDDVERLMTNRGVLAIESDVVDRVYAAAWADHDSDAIEAS